MPSVVLQAPGIDELAIRLRRIEQAMGRPDVLLKQWGVAILREIDTNFAVGGRPKWAPLSDWTIAGRRDPRRKGGTSGEVKPLQDTGKLRRSWTYRVEVGERESRVIAYSRDPKAPWHEFGVKPRALIEPRNAQALALPALHMGPTGYGGMGIRPQKSYRGLGRSVRVGGREAFIYQPKGKASRRFAGREGKTVVPYKDVWFRRAIHDWPGVPARPMLPTEAQIRPVLRAVADELMARWIRR